MLFVGVTNTDNSKIFINFEHVSCFFKDANDESTSIFEAGENHSHWSVLEKPEQILKCL